MPFLILVVLSSGMVTYKNSGTKVCNTRIKADAMDKNGVSKILTSFMDSPSVALANSPSVALAKKSPFPRLVNHSNHMLCVSTTNNGIPYSYTPTLLPRTTDESPKTQVKNNSANDERLTRLEFRCVKAAAQDSI